MMASYPLWTIFIKGLILNFNKQNIANFLMDVNVEFSIPVYKNL